MRDLHTNTKKPITLIITGLVVLTGLTAAGLHIVTSDKPEAPAKTVASTTSESAKVKASSTTLVEFTAAKDKTVLEQLKTKAKVEVKDSQYGPFVESINGIKGGTDNKYWSYYVDGQMASVGAGEYVTKGGEDIVWKFE
jgi:hypothetical protein